MSIRMWEQQVRTDLPRVYRGCWKRAGFRRRYKRAWQASKRSADPKFYAAELAAQRARKRLNSKSTREVRRRNRATWITKPGNRAKQNDWRDEQREPRAECFGCGISKRRSHKRFTRFQKVERLVDLGAGTFAKRMVDWCGHC